MSAAREHPPRLATLGTAMLAAAVLCGCSNPDAPAGSTVRRPVVSGSAGEPPAPRPLSPGSQSPAEVQASPQAALSLFARRYINWSYRTLSADQWRLAAMAVGPARLAERQAAASSRTDVTLRRGRVFNRGQVVSVARDRARRGWWVIVTREQTGGSGEYEGLPAAFHVTLARLARLTGGYAVETWSPQS